MFLHTPTFKNMAAIWHRWPYFRIGAGADYSGFCGFHHLIGDICACGSVFSRWPSEEWLAQHLGEFCPEKQPEEYPTLDPVPYRLCIPLGVHSVVPGRPESPWSRPLYFSVSPAITPHLRLEIFVEDNIHPEFDLLGGRGLRFLDDWEIILHGDAGVSVEVDADDRLSDGTDEDDEQQSYWTIYCKRDFTGSPRLVTWDGVAGELLPVENVLLPRPVRKFLRCLRCAP